METIVREMETKETTNHKIEEKDKPLMTPQQFENLGIRNCLEMYNITMGIRETDEGLMILLDEV